MYYSQLKTDKNSRMIRAGAAMTESILITAGSMFLASQGLSPVVVIATPSYKKMDTNTTKQRLNKEEMEKLWYDSNIKNKEKYMTQYNYRYDPQSYKKYKEELSRRKY